MTDTKLVAALDIFVSGADTWSMPWVPCPPNILGCICACLVWFADDCRLVVTVAVAVGKLAAVVEAVDIFVNRRDNNQIVTVFNKFVEDPS